MANWAVIPNRKGRHRNVESKASISPGGLRHSLDIRHVQETCPGPSHANDLGCFQQTLLVQGNTCAFANLQKCQCYVK